MNQYATMARFDGARQRRRSLIAKVHVARKELGLAEDDYRAVLLRITGRMSAAECDERQLGAVLDEMKRHGFVAKPARASRSADHPSALKARALWISLHALGVIDNPSEQALEAFARRQLGCERLQWAKQGQSFRLIEALKAMAARAGWDQSTDGIDRAAVPVALRRRLVERLVEKMKAIDLIPADWRVTDAAWRLAGIRMEGFLTASAGDLDLVAKALGAKLREAKDAGIGAGEG